jgi:hypothetical protein
MSITDEAKSLLLAIEKLDKFSKLMHQHTTELKAHYSNFETAKSGEESSYHLKKHTETFNNIKKAKEAYNELLKEVEYRLQRIEKNIKELEKR